MDWANLLRVGLHRLQLQPDAFWRLTPVELQMMLGLEDSLLPMGRARLDELQAAYPDH